MSSMLTEFDVLEEDATVPSKTNHNPTLLKINLRHGDILIMNNMQHCYEHAVFPKGMRMAMTARTIY